MEKKMILLLAIFGILLGISMSTTYAVFSGTHAISKNRTTPAEFCTKCHPDKVSSISVSAHANAGCICHGYNPNFSEIYNINLAHNLTKQIYCTNCHSNYDDSGNITIHRDSGVDISGINQSAHYITSDTAVLYKHAKQFFVNSTE